MTAIQPVAVATVPLREVATIYSGGTPSKANASFWVGDIPWVSPKDMGEDRISDAEDHISADAVEGSATKLVPTASILVVVRSGILVRKLPIGLTTRPVAFNQDIKALVVDETRFLPEFVFWLLRAAEPRALVVGVKKGATVHSLSAGYLESIPVPVLPLDEQRRIVDTLNHGASIRRLREEARAKARDIIPALFVDMFGDPATNPKGWPVKTVGEVISAADYGTSVKCSENPSGVPVLRMGNVAVTGELLLDDLKYADFDAEELAKLRLEAGDILFNRTNSKDLVGKTGLWDGRFEAAAASYFIRVRMKPGEMSPTYFWAFFNGKHMKRRLFETARGAIGQANINTKELKAFPIPVPPIKLQQEFAERVAEVEGISSLNERAATAAEQMAQSLLAQVFGQAA